MSSFQRRSSERPGSISRCCANTIAKGVRVVKNSRWQPAGSSASSAPSEKCSHQVLRARLSGRWRNRFDPCQPERVVESERPETNKSVAKEEMVCPVARQPSTRSAAKSCALRLTGPSLTWRALGVGSRANSSAPLLGDEIRSLGFLSSPRLFFLLGGREGGK